MELFIISLQGTTKLRVISKAFKVGYINLKDIGIISCMSNKEEEGERCGGIIITLKNGIKELKHAPTVSLVLDELKSLRNCSLTFKIEAKRPKILSIEDLSSIFFPLFSLERNGLSNTSITILMDLT